MKISQLLQTTKPSFSFEFFPPKTDADASALMDTARALKGLNPTYISVTWGAGGSTRSKTLDIVSAVKRDVGVEAMAHLTCVGASRAELDGVLDEIESRGIENILALRGDPPKGETVFQPHPEGFRYANELVAHIKKRGKFCIGVAGYPEGHIECPDKVRDLENLKRKVDAGADFIVTQLFFDNADYFRFVYDAQRVGIKIPIVPGIMPVTNVAQLQRFTALCGAKIPDLLRARLETIKDDKDAVVRAGVDYATLQCRELLDRGAPGIHFYTLNRSLSTTAILKNLKS